MSNLKAQLTNLIETAVFSASKLNKRLSDNDNTALKSSMNTILPIAERLERLMRTTQVDSLNELSLELEVCAVTLWNAATLSIKSEPSDVRQTLCSTKFFACLLCSIHEIMNPSLKVKFRAMSCFVKSLKSALDEDEIKLASNIQEHADRVFKSLESTSSSFEPDLLKDFQKVKTELFIIKMQLSMIENDVEMAKFFEERADLTNQSKEFENADIILESSRIIFNSCLALYDKGRYQDVVHFLRKCIAYLDGETDELKLVKSSICSLLAYSCIELKTQDSYQVASYAIEKLQQCSPSSLDSFKLDIKLKRLQKVHASDIENIIMRMLISIPIMENFKQILSIINEHSNSDPISAIKCYDFAFTNKLDPMTDQDSLEMLFVAIINAYIKDKTTPSDLKQSGLKKFLENAEKIFVKPVGKKTSSSSVTLLWTTGKAESKNNNFQDAIGWLKLCLHRVININEIDKAKVQRALQNCFIELEKFDQVVDIYKEMRESEKKALTTQYNMFRVYSIKEDQEQLIECLKNISCSNDSNMVPLLALCAVNTNANSAIAIESMLTLFKKLSDGLDSVVSIPVTLRSVISLILKQQDSYSNFFRSQYIDTLMILLKEGFRFASDSINIKDYKFTNDELKWFSSRSFNIARSCLLADNYLQGQLFSGISIDFNRLISDDISIQDSIWLKLWRFRSSLIGIICSSKISDVDQHVLWSSIREQSLNLRICIDEMTVVYKETPEFKKFEKEWGICLLDSIIYQYQAELELRNWSAAETIINETSRLTTTEFDSTLINIVTEDKFPSHVKSSVISKVVQRNFNSTSLDGVVLSRWLRLLLKFSMDSFEAEEICLKILNQIYTKLRSQGQVENTLPSHEIEWLSSNCWNIGVGRLFNDDKLQGKVWCTIAIKLASFVNERFETTLKNLWDELTVTTTT